MIKMIPLKQWVCDSCGEVIEKPEDGWFEWYGGKRKSIETGFRIVHHNKSCMYDDRELTQRNLSPHDLNLTDVLGTQGLGHLLQRIELGEKGELNKIDIRQVVEIMRRLYIPYYEEARLYWDDAFRDGFHDGCGFEEEVLLGVIENYGGDRPSR